MSRQRRPRPAPETTSSPKKDASPSPTRTKPTKPRGRAQGPTTPVNTSTPPLPALVPVVPALYALLGQVFAEASAFRLTFGALVNALRDADASGDPDGAGALPSTVRPALAQLLANDAQLWAVLTQASDERLWIEQIRAMEAQELRPGAAQLPPRHALLPALLNACRSPRAEAAVFRTEAALAAHSSMHRWGQDKAAREGALLMLEAGNIEGLERFAAYIEGSIDGKRRGVCS